MADLEQIKLLKQGVTGWNTWRREFSIVQPSLNNADLSGADLRSADLNGADLSGANLRNADLRNVDLNNANLSNANLSGANLHNADLFEADLNNTNLNGANLSFANLRSADLFEADLRSANLSGADLRGAALFDADCSSADLSNANLDGAGLDDADLSATHVDQTIFANIDLSFTKGLAEIKHWGPSRVELHTVQLPQDGSALHFLRGAGVPDKWIDDYRVRMTDLIQYHSLFISYSSKDEMLAARLHADLQTAGVRCWFAPEDMKIGDKIRQRIDEAIHMQDKLLLLLSKHVLASGWVADEVEAALEKEKRQQREVLFPIRLDNAVMQTPEAWAAALRRTRHIGDFTAWTDPSAYQVAFDRLFRDLKQN